MTGAGGASLGACLATASRLWRDNKTLVSLASKGIRLVGGSQVQADTLCKAASGVKLLVALRDERLSIATQRQAYRAFRRMLSVNDVATTAWPAAPSLPRVRSREPLSDRDFGRLIAHLDAAQDVTTSDLALLLKATGLRVRVEALGEKSLELLPGTDYDTLKVIGKGGHERFIPVVDPEVRSLLADPKRMAGIRSRDYHLHWRHWTSAVTALGISSKLPTPHAARHYFATRMLERSGGNLVLVQELLGHSSPTVTARYLHVNLDSKAKAMGLGES